MLRVYKRFRKSFFFRWCRQKLPQGFQNLSVQETVLVVLISEIPETEEVRDRKGDVRLDKSRNPVITLSQLHANVKQISTDWGLVLRELLLELRLLRLATMTGEKRTDQHQAHGSLTPRQQSQTWSPLRAQVQQRTTR